MRFLISFNIVTNNIIYHRVSFKYSRIKMFFNGTSADTIATRGGVTFNLNLYQFTKPCHWICKSQ